MTSNRPSTIRTGSVFVRALHLLAASAVAGGYLLSGEVEVPLGWWIAAGVSGVVLLAAECSRHRELYRELAGWATLVKLGLIGVVPILPGVASPWLMGAAFVVAVLGAHSPKVWRHRRLL